MPESAWVVRGRAVSLGVRIIDSPGELTAKRPQVADFAARRWDWECCADQYHDIFAGLFHELGQKAVIA